MTHPEYERYHPIGWGPRLNTEEKAGHAQAVALLLSDY